MRSEKFSYINTYYNPQSHPKRFNDNEYVTR